MRLKPGGNRGGRGKCILGTSIRMEREEFKSCHPRLLVPDESEFEDSVVTRDAAVAC